MFLFPFLFFVLFVYFIYLYSPCPSLNCPVGLCFWTHGMTSDWLPFGFPPRLPGHCRLVLTGSHDSLVLWYPAIDIVWLGPVFLALGSLSHLALRGSAWWSPSPSGFGLQSLSQTPSLTFLTLTHDLTFTILHLWYCLWYQTPMVNLYYGCLSVPSFTSACLYLCTSRRPFQ